MQAPRWNEERTCKFVDIYKEHECLWDIQNSSYRNIKARKLAINDMMLKMGIKNFTIMEVKQKVKNLRCTFHQEYKKIENSDADNVHEPSMKWFPTMEMIIMNQGTLRKTSQNNLDTSPNSESDEIDDIRQSPIYSQKSRKIVNIPQTIINNRRQLKKNTCYLTSTLKELKELKCLQQVTSSSTGPTKFDAECEAFGRHVVAQLHELPPIQRIFAQDDIQKVLSKRRLETLSSRTDNFTNTPSSGHSSILEDNPNAIPECVLSQHPQQSQDEATTLLSNITHKDSDEL